MVFLGFSVLGGDKGSKLAIPNGVFGVLEGDEDSKYRGRGMMIMMYEFGALCSLPQNFHPVSDITEAMYGERGI